VASLPEYLLLIDTLGEEPGEWRLVLKRLGGQGGRDEIELDITDVEPGVRGERLELLTAVRGLEALDQPSRVTIISSSRYLRNGIELGMPEWRAKGWTWELFGRLETVKHAELWQRLDRSASFHDVHCAAPPRNSYAESSWPGRERDNDRELCEGERWSRAKRHRVDRAHRVVPRGQRRGLWSMVKAFVTG